MLVSKQSNKQKRERDSHLSASQGKDASKTNEFEQIKLIKLNMRKGNGNTFELI